MPVDRFSLKAALCAVALVCWSAPPSAQDGAIERIMTASCSGCHSRDDAGTWSRISEQRKTPEGWQMTLVRMQMVHGARIVDPQDEKNNDAMRKLVKHLADTQGLAPEERAPGAFVLERRLNTVEKHDSGQFAQMCARCHTGARVALQRRTEDEWHNLVHFHLGQFPTTEYQLMGRDRDWLGVALEEMVPWLAEHFPYQSEAWENWRALDAPSLAGRWRVAGEMPGRGFFAGYMIAVAAGEDRYRLELEGSFEDGSPLEGDGDAIVYTGYEWRGSIDLGGEPYRQVFAADTAGKSMQGRMFQRDHEEWGLTLSAAREAGEPRLLAVQPGYIKAGAEARLTLIGSDMPGSVNLGPGLEIVEETERELGRVVVRVRASESAEPGRRDIRVGKAALPGALTVYRSMDRIAVEPEYAVGRVGDNGGSQPKVEAIFQAIAWSNGEDGKPGTADDLRIGQMPAQWSVAPWDERAEKDRDVDFAGTMNSSHGIFTPAAAGPNPERQYSTNNAGNLEVIAEVEDGGNSLTGSGHLIVTVQRWNNPPIR